MFKKPKGLFQHTSQPVMDQINDPDLGVLTWSKDDETWLTDPAYSKCGFTFYIAGETGPDVNLIAHAADILHAKERYLSAVSFFLSQEIEKTQNLHSYSAEVNGLSIECICLCWPDRPNDGMIYFNGGRNNRVWRCEYIDRQPKDLGFDS